MAQRTTNNPPFGYRFLGDVADDITELFSLVSGGGTIEQITLDTDALYYYFNTTTPGVATPTVEPHLIKKGTLQLYKADGTLAIDGTDFYLLGPNGDPINTSDSIWAVDWRAAGAPAVAFGVVGTGGDWTYEEDGGGI